MLPVALSPHYRLFIKIALQYTSAITQKPIELFFACLLFSLELYAPT